MRRLWMIVAVLAVVVSYIQSASPNLETIAPSPTPDPAPRPGQPWSAVDNCREKNPARPAYLEIWFSGVAEEESDDGAHHPWSQSDVRDALDRAGLPYGTSTHWPSALWPPDLVQIGIEIPGTVGTLLEGAVRLAHQQTHDEAVPPPDVEIACAGQPALTSVIQLALPHEVDGYALARRYGKLETAKKITYEDDWYWEFLTKGKRFVVERTIEYLSDPRVLSARAVEDCGGGVPMGAPPPPFGCDDAIEVTPPPRPTRCETATADDWCRKTIRNAQDQVIAQPAYPGSTVVATDVGCCVLLNETEVTSECSNYQTDYGTVTPQAYVIAWYEELGFVAREAFELGTWRGISPIDYEKWR